jgi:hypothetical protein
MICRPIDRIEYIGDLTHVVFEETDELPEVTASFDWWTLPFEFDDDIQSNPQRQYLATIRCALGAPGESWVVLSPPTREVGVTPTGGSATLPGFPH